MNTKEKNLSILLLMVLLLFISLIIMHPPYAFGQDNEKKVLFISSYSESFETVPLQTQGIREVFSREDISFDIEYMDTRHFDTEENVLLFFEHLKYKLDHSQHYDALIVGDDRALKFAVDYQSELFPDIPIVFFCVNDINRAVSAAKNPSITGIIEEISLKDNIELGLKFNPDASRVVAFIDESFTGIGDTMQFFRHAEDFPGLEFTAVNSADYTFEGLGQKIEEYGDESILLYLSMYVDNSGTYHTIKEYSKLFADHAKVPVYRATIGGVGDGILGGKMVSYEISGKMAAEMVVDVFNGIPIEDIPLVRESPNYYTLDYKLLKKYHIDPKLAPKDTIFLNKDPSFYQQHKKLVWTMTIIVLVLTLMIFILIVDNIKRRVIEKALKESRDHLTQANEELTATEEELRDQYVKIQENMEKINLLNERFEISTNSTNSAIWELELSTQRICFSENIRSIVGNDVNDCENAIEFQNKIFSKESIALFNEEFISYLGNEKSEINIQLPIITEDDSAKWIMIRGKGVRTASGELTHLHGILLDNTKLKEQELYIEHLAHYDYLTNLPNRLCFMDKLKEEIELGHPLAIIMFDIDNFKEINDTLGHVYGDMLLKEIADRLTDLQNNKMFISRFGGDEFLILISDNIETKLIEKHVHRIQRAFKDPFQIGHREHFIEFSMGISRFPLDSDNLHQLIMNADTAMYKVKHGGKSNYQFYDESMQESLKERASVETLLRRALKEDGFYLMYQPIVDVMSGEVHGFEALLRLKNHKIPPNVFIPVAEDSDIILEIGRKVTQEAIAQIAEWKSKGFPPKKVSINFSSRQLKDHSYFDFLASTLEKYQVDPQYLTIEITESILLEDTTYTMDFLYKLRDLGVSLVMDDFGTGYSSINYLTYLPVEQIKLDKSLSDKFLKLDNVKVMNSIISLAHSLNLKITAEGVEDGSQYERLKEGGCDFIQGYYFSKPLEITKADEIYNKKLI